MLVKTTWEFCLILQNDPRKVKVEFLLTFLPHKVHLTILLIRKIMVKIYIILDCYGHE